MSCYDWIPLWRLEHDAACLKVRHSQHDQRRIYFYSMDVDGMLRCVHKIVHVGYGDSNFSSSIKLSQRSAHSQGDYQVRFAAIATSLDNPKILDSYEHDREVPPFVAHNMSVHSQIKD